MDDLIRHLASTYIFPTVMFIVMFGLGLALDTRLIQRTFARPIPLFTGLAGQVLLLPLLAFLWASFGPWTSAVALGLFVVSVCPGGTTSNTIVFAMRGDIALSVSLTALSSLVTLITIPFFLTAGLSALQGDSVEIAVPISVILTSLIQMILLPVALGMGLRRFAEPIALRVIEPLRKLSLVLLAMIITLSIYNARRFFTAEIVELFLASAGMVVLVWFAGFVLTRLMKLDLMRQMTIVIEIGVQNTILAIYLGASVLQSPELTIAAIMFGLLNYAMVAIVYLVVRKPLKPFQEPPISMKKSD